MSHVLLAEQQLKALLKCLKPKIEGFLAFLPGTIIITQAGQIACIKYLHFNLLNGRSKWADTVSVFLWGKRRGPDSCGHKK